MTAQPWNRENRWLTLLVAELCVIYFFVPAGRFHLSFFGYAFTTGYDAYKLFPVVILTWWGWRKGLKDKPWPQSYLYLPMIVFFLASLLSTLGSHDIYQASAETLELSAYMVFFFILLDIPWKKEHLLPIAVAFVVGNLYLGGVAARQYFKYGLGNPTARVNATFEHPNALGIYAILGASLLLWLSTYSAKLYQKAVIWTAFAFVLFAALVSVSRAAYVAFLVWGILFCRYGTGSLRKWGWALLFAAGLVILLWVPRSLSRFEALYTHDQAKGEIIRLYIWSFLMDKEIPSLPFFGLGMGRIIYDRMANWIVASPAPDILWREWGSHNYFLDLLISTGLPGLFAFCWLLISAFRLFQSCPDRIGLILKAGWAGFGIHFLFAEPLLVGNIPIALFTLFAVGNHYSQVSIPNPQATHEASHLPV